MNIKDGLELVAEFVGGLAEGHHPKAVYRGHADWDWEIRPSAFRVGRHGITDKKQLRRWIGAASRFAQPRPQSDLEWLVLAQHYGIATPLLDWTTNPLVALFFACQRTESKAKGCVIRFVPNDFEIFTAPGTVEAFKRERSKPGLIDASAMNPRTLAQDSAMSLHTEEMPCLPLEGHRVYEVHQRNKVWISEALRSFGLTPERIYSDLTIAAREFNDQLELDYLLG